VFLRVNHTDNEQGVFEPFCDFIHDTGLLVSKVITVSKDQKIPVRFCNLGTEPVPLYPNKAVGVFEGAVVVDRIPSEMTADTTDWNINSDLSETEKARVLEVLEANSDLFSSHEFDLGTTSLMKHQIDLEQGTKPYRQRQRPISLPLRDKVDEKISQMLKYNIVEPSSSPWASNLVVVRKKSGDIRLCIDWRQLNTATIKDAYPLPNLHQAMDALAGSEWFSTIDCRQGFNQVDIEESDRHKTAFYSTQGLLQFRKMGFGMCNAPATFQRLMELALSGLTWQEVMVYVDDIVLYSKTFDQHIETIRRVFDRLRKAGLKLNRKKSAFAQRRIKFLGHIVDNGGISPDPEKVSAVLQIPSPSSSTEVRRFVGILSFYRRFIHDFSETAAPLHAISLKSNFLWSEECEVAFRKLKQCLSRAPVLRLPDFSKTFILACDASNSALGAVLSQRHFGTELPVAYASRTLNKAERNYRLRTGNHWLSFEAGSISVLTC